VPLRRCALRCGYCSLRARCVLDLSAVSATRDSRAVSVSEGLY